MNPTPPGVDRAKPVRPTDRGGPGRARSIVLVAVAFPTALVLMAGCGRLRRNTTADSSTSTSGTSAVASNGSSTTLSAAAKAESATLASIDQQLSTVDSQLGDVGSNLSTSDSAINTQEGDPSK